MAPLKVIIFDLYNTLLYVSKKNSPYKEILKVSPKPRATWEYILTRYFVNGESLFKNLQIKGLINKNIDQEVFQKKLEIELGSVKDYPEVLRTLAELKDLGYKLGVISNLTTPYIAPFINSGMDKMIDYIIFSCEIGFTKPSPVIYNQLLKKAICDYKTISFNEMLMIGNNYNYDVWAPKQIGMQALLLDRSGSIHNGVKISSLNELCINL